MQPAPRSHERNATPGSSSGSRGVLSGVPGRTHRPSALPASAIRLRAYLIGLAGTLMVDLWIHYAELVLGGTRGHSALANTSIPLGAFCALFILVLLNRSLRSRAPRQALAPAELLVAYVMMATATVLSSSGMLHFIVPTVAAPIYFATAENRWAQLFHPYLKPWMAQTDAAALRGFYRGGEPVPVGAWLPQMATWCGFLVLLALTALCLAAIVRRQWVDRERLTFPTVFLPLELIRNDESFLSSRLLWLGAALPLVIGVFNNLNLNVPAMPRFDVRNQDLQPYITDPPWNAIGYTPVSFFPFVIGIAYLLSLDVVFSGWFFFLVTRAESVFGAANGLREGAAGGAQSVFPYLGHQGAGAFLAIAVLSLWLARGYLADVFRTALGKPWAARGSEGDEGRHHTPLEDRDEPLPYRWAGIGLLLGFTGLVLFAVAGGMRFWVAIIFFVVALAYWLAATRIRAETGNAWLFGPEVDANRLLTTSLGTAVYLPGELTMMAFLRSVSSFDLRCITMPHELDGFKMADGVGISPRRLVPPIILAVVVGAVATFWIALTIWYQYGALAKTDSWRTLQGRQPFELLAGYLTTPVKPDHAGSVAVAIGFAVTSALTLLRMRLTWWPFHPVGYALANTATMASTWVPFLIAWLCKSLVLRYGGMRLYRRSLPFFLGLILGDFLNGGFWTLLGCFTQISIYPINW
jgi:hypothetical protein